MIRFNLADIESARQGSRAGLAAVVRAAERPVFNLSIRMLANRADAEDATQEILVKLITHLGSLRDIEAAGAWAMRIACRHLVAERKRGRVEAMRLTFKGFAADLESGLSPLEDSNLSHADAALAVEEVKVGCTLAMLTCLSREQRIAYILGEIFEIADLEAASILNIAPAAYRQRLRRARSRVLGFTSLHCGIVSEKSTCRCERRVSAAIACGRVQPGISQFGFDHPSPTNLRDLRSKIAKLEDGRQVAAVMRSNPDFSSRIGELVLELVK